MSVVNLGESEAFRALRFHGRRPGLPVETFPLSELVSRFGASFLQVTERVSFHVVILCTAGNGRHQVDFDRVDLRPGRVLHVRPTQVQRWELSRRYEAQLVLFPDGSDVAEVSRWPIGPAVLDPPDRSWTTALHTIALIAEQQETFTGDPDDLQMLRTLRQLVVLQLRLAHAGQATEAALPAAYLAFRDAVQADLGRTHQVSDYAAKLGYSARTLSRACREARGLTAKQVLDEWLSLEARRLLACSDEPVAAIAAALGFDEATNFTKFFRRVAGSTPTAFRKTHCTRDCCTSR